MNLEESTASVLSPYLLIGVSLKALIMNVSTPAGSIKTLVYFFLALFQFAVKIEKTCVRDIYVFDFPETTTEYILKKKACTTCLPCIYVVRLSIPFVKKTIKT